jgi:hypothetical protein
LAQAGNKVWVEVHELPKQSARLVVGAARSKACHLIAAASEELAITYSNDMDENDKIDRQ